MTAERQTPETDAVVFTPLRGEYSSELVVRASVAHRLERERDEARERIMELEKECKAANALLHESFPCVEYCATVDDGSWVQQHPAYTDLARRIRAHLEKEKP